MKKHFLFSMALVSFLNADLLDDIFKKSKVNGYIRTGYQDQDISYDKSYKSDSIGGKLHFETSSYKGINGGISFYTTNKIKNNDGEGMAFFDSDNQSYTILGEAYLLWKFDNTAIKLGRQEIDTPFADTDDVGMIPNTFEAGVLTNKDLPDTTLFFAQIQKWAGVDAPVPETFTKMQNDDSVQAFGVLYDGIKGLSLNGWYYDFKAINSGDVNDIGYLDAVYESTINNIKYEAGFQYANQSYKTQESSKIYGAYLSLVFSQSGLTFSGAYNKVKDHEATNGFGGGPFFTNDEDLTIAELGQGKSRLFGLEWDASVIGLNGVSFTYEDLELKSDNGKDADENDFIMSYDIKDNLNLTVIYSDIDDKINSDKFTNTRVFINYNF